MDRKQVDFVDGCIAQKKPVRFKHVNGVDVLDAVPTFMSAEEVSVIVYRTHPSTPYLLKGQKTYIAVDEVSSVELLSE